MFAGHSSLSEGKINLCTMVRIYVLASRYVDTMLYLFSYIDGKMGYIHTTQIIELVDIIYTHRLTEIYQKSLYK